MSGSEASFARALRGPVVLITVGVLFALNNFTHYRFSETWPVLLIVFGLMSLLSRGTENGRPVPGSGPAAGRPGFPPYGYTAPDDRSIGYRQSPYIATPAPAPPEPEPAKGGFGGSAPPRPPDPGQTPPGGSL
jgi:hypothetical protein